MCRSDVPEWIKTVLFAWAVELWELQEAMDSPAHFWMALLDMAGQCRWPGLV